MDSSDSPYTVVGRIVGGIASVITFVGSWIYCIAEYGFLLGVGLGWLPALITAAIVGIVVGVGWPLIALGLFWLLWMWSKSN